VRSIRSFLLSPFADLLAAYSFHVDIWSLGLVFLQLVAGLNSHQLCALVTTSCEDPALFVLDPRRVPFLVREIDAKYRDSIAQLAPIVSQMITEKTERKSAEELLERFEFLS
jgi:serine/threonine protein kinase